MYIYIHIPFCNRICSYCDFPKMLYNKNFVNKYLDSLESEINSRYNGQVVKSIFIGGGTPTSLSYLELKRLFDILSIFNKDKNIEFSIESNIDSLDFDKVKLLKYYGVNRVSLGVQSFNKDNLRELNRFHNKNDVKRVINYLKDVGINNISIDLIYGINTNMDIVVKDIDCFLELDIPHISCYSLIIEDNTLFKIRNREYIDSDIEYEMYKYIENTLTSNGYNHYEISNYSRDGFESKHNINYWCNGEYYGFGLGAVSYINYNRISNTRNMTKYINNNYVDSSIYESKSVRMSNDIILGLRMLRGINIKEFNNKYKVSILDTYNISDLIKDNKLIISNNYMYINANYLYLSNEILLRFI